VSARSELASPAALPAWPDVLAAALVGGARSGQPAETLLDAAAAHALRRRAGAALLHGVALPPPAPADETPVVRPAAAARAGDLLAFDDATRRTGPLRDVESRLELVTEWLSAAAAAGWRVPPELVPALLDAGRRHRGLRPLIGPVAGARAGWLAEQRADWSYARSTAAPSAVPAADGGAAWEFGSTEQRVRYLVALRRTDPTAGRALLESAWDAEAPEDRAALLQALGVGLTGDDEALLERALDDRRKEVRVAALPLLGRLPGSAYGTRMAARAAAHVHLDRPGWIRVSPPAECDRSMRRDGIAPRPPGGVGERAWWLEEILARTPLSVWPRDLFSRRVSEGWPATLRRSLARAAATQRHGEWAAALVDDLTAEVAASGHPDDRLLLEALYDVLPADDLAQRAVAALRRGLATATAVGVEHVLHLCPRPWPEPLVEAVFAALADVPGGRGAGWRVSALCELAALRLPAACAPRAAALVERLRAAAGYGAPADPGIAIIERFAGTLRFRHDMIGELA